MATIDMSRLEKGDCLIVKTVTAIGRGETRRDVFTIGVHDVIERRVNDREVRILKLMVGCTWNPTTPTWDEFLAEGVLEEGKGMPWWHHFKATRAELNGEVVFGD